jgi:phage tail sheath protein FI
MAGAYKTPGVYIKEVNAFPNSVVEVATAVPAFIGYTQIHDNKGSSLKNKAARIASLSEYETFFGKGPLEVFDITENNDDNIENDFKIADAGYVLAPANAKKVNERFYMYNSMRLFFQNGGGACYVVSVGTYKKKKEDGTFEDEAIARKALEEGIDALLKEQEPTMVILPDAVALDQENCIGLQQYSLKHCDKMQNRFAIIDIHNGYLDRDKDVEKDCVSIFRGSLGVNYLKYSAAYYPWLNTSIVQKTDLDFKNFAKLDDLKKLLVAEAGGDSATAEMQDILKQFNDDDYRKTLDANKQLSDDELHKILFSVSPIYKKIIDAMTKRLNVLPPAAAMAGVYTMVDNARGVWKAPANVSLASVSTPTVNITHDDHEDLNVSTTGKSINAIRTFIGEGVLVWGARTLDGNSLDWRYINVRRTMIMLEESLRLATKAYVFEPNVSGTWINIKSMASNFLTGIWKRGGLAGASPEDAFSVHVGLGETMTGEDILEGYLKVTILVALVRPAEFIEITFKQQMQKS